MGGGSVAGQSRGILPLQASLVGFLTPSVSLLKQTFTVRSGNIILVLSGCSSERLVPSLSCKPVLGWCVRTTGLFALLVPKPSLISKHGAGVYTWSSSVAPGRFPIILIHPQHRSWAELAGHELLQAEGVVCTLHCVCVNLGMVMAQSFSLQHINWAPFLREGKLAPGSVVRDAASDFLVCHPQRMCVAVAPGPVNHEQAGRRQQIKC